MKIRRFAKHAVAGVLVLMSFWSSPVMAQRDRSHAAAAPASADQKAKASALVKVVREATARFQDVAVAEADYLVLAKARDDKHDSPPELMGQLLHLFEAPNRFGLPAFYTLHVWAWKHSPTGTFVNWHTNVSCDAFSG